MRVSIVAGDSCNRWSTMAWGGANVSVPTKPGIGLRAERYGH